MASTLAWHSGNRHRGMHQSTAALRAHARSGMVISASALRSVATAACCHGMAAHHVARRHWLHGAHIIVALRISGIASSISASIGSA